MEAAGLANEIRAAAHAKMEAKFEAEARAFHALTADAGAEGPGQEPVIDLSAPVEATPDTKRKVSAFCHNPVAEKLGITYHGFENPLAEAHAARTDAALDCLGALADWLGTLDEPSKFVTAMPSALIACTTGLRYPCASRSIMCLQRCPEGVPSILIRPIVSCHRHCWFFVPRPLASPPARPRS
jgi:hypothetical protein